MNSFDLARILREELETKHVRDNIHKWIDLIFGVDQKNPDKFNLFFPAAYPDYHCNNRIEKMMDDEDDSSLEIQKNLISNMSEMCIMPPCLFKSNVDQLIQKSRRKMESSSSRAVAYRASPQVFDFDENSNYEPK